MFMINIIEQREQRVELMAHHENNGSGTKELDGQVALVTGGGRGLGRAYAQALASVGATVAVVARSTNQVEQTVAQITAGGGRALAVTADVSDRQAVMQAVRSIEAQFGPVDLLINNAGIAVHLVHFGRSTQTSGGV